MNKLNITRKMQCSTLSSMRNVNENVGEYTCFALPKWFSAIRLYSFCLAMENPIWHIQQNGIPDPNQQK